MRRTRQRPPCLGQAGALLRGSISLQSSPAGALWLLETAFFIFPPFLTLCIFRRRIRSLAEHAQPQANKKGSTKMQFNTSQMNTIPKVLCALFSLFLLISITMTGTYAWRDINQHKSNEFYGRSPTYPSDTTTTLPDSSTTTTLPDSSTTTTLPDSSTTTTLPDSSTTTNEITTQPSTSSDTTITSLTNPQNPDSPKTDDTSNVWLWVILTVVSAVCLRGVLLWGKKDKRKAVETGGLL